MLTPKPCDKITPEDLAKHPVWTFDLKNEALPGRDETWMVPVTKLPVSSLNNHGCLANAVLACGKKMTAMLWSIDLTSQRRTEQFIAIAFWLNDRWWHLSQRPFLSESGNLESHLPNDLASKLGLDLNEVFPIAYDISQIAIGPSEITQGKILIEPREKLTKSQRMALALQRRG